MHVRRGLLVIVGLFAAIACSGEPLYKVDAGPFTVRIIEHLSLTDTVQGRDVDLRILYPGNDKAGPFPLVVFSTGMFCYPQMYDRITAHWVSHGYVVIQPNHLDSPNNAVKMQPSQEDIVLPSRARDVSFVLDAADKISERAGMPGMIDPKRSAVGGHSFGAVISMIKIGLYLKDQYKGPWGETYDERFKAAVLMSGVGPGMEQMADNAFDGLRRPLMASGGTKDVGRVKIGDRTPAEWRMQPYLLAPPGDKYSVITEGTDHYMGGLICNEKLGSGPDYEAVATVRAMTTAFLDAYVKNDAAALDYLHTVDVEKRTHGRAHYQYR